MRAASLRDAVILGGLLSLLGLLGVPALWLLQDGDPDRLVRQPLPDVAATTVVPYGGAGCGPDRRCLDVTLDPQAARPVRIAVSLPEDRGARRLPAVILAGGLRTGRAALALLPDLGRNAVITYEYPLARDHWRRGFLPVQIVVARDAALAVPGQLAAVVRWTRTQPWADPERVSLVGVSLGALVLPAAQRAAAVHGEPSGPGILAFGGAGLFEILRANFLPDRPWLGSALAWLGAFGLRALEPAAHLPHLRGELLLINGRDDTRIPPAAAARLRLLAPEPKEVRLLSAGHIDPDRRQLVDRILAISRSWLMRRGALEPLRRGSRAGARGSPAATASASRSRPGTPAPLPAARSTAASSA